jgi:hypothetical protein
MLQTKIVQKIKTYFMFKNFPFFENLTVCDIMWNGIVEPGSPQMAIEYGACALHAGYLKLQTPAQII